MINLTFEFEVKEPLGTGLHGRVYRVEESTTHDSYACKDIQMANPALRHLQKSEVKGEILILKKLRHTHIITLAAYIEDTAGFRILLDPLADCNLEEYLDDCAGENFDSSRTEPIYSWFACLLTGLQFAHSMDVKHQDIKPTNFLVKSRHIYISDFSLAKDFTGDKSRIAGEAAAGNWRYGAPETRDNTAGGREADVFSLGCVFSEMLTVIHGRSHKDLERECKTERRTDIFRKCLLLLEKWLGEIDKKARDGNRTRTICTTILYMIAETEVKRYSAHRALTQIEEVPELACKHQHYIDPAGKSA